jgi:hypothetical protein
MDQVTYRSSRSPRRVDIHFSAAEIKEVLYKKLSKSPRRKKQRRKTYT